MGQRAEIDAYAVLLRFVGEHKRQADAAMALGVTASYLSDLVNKRRDISDSILSKLGLRRAVVKQ